MEILSRNTRFSKNLVNLDIRLLTNYYKSLGFYDVKISSNSAELNKNEGIDLIYTIDAGQRYRINKISTNVEDTLDKEIFLPLNKKYKEVIGEYYSPFKIKNLLEEIDLIIEKIAFNLLNIMSKKLLKVTLSRLYLIFLKVKKS